MGMAYLFHRNGIWYVRFTDAQDRRRCQSLKVRDRAAAEVMMGSIVHGVEKARAGIVEPDWRAAMVDAAMEAWRDRATALSKSAEYVARTVRAVRKVCHELGVTRLDKIAEHDLARYIDAELKRGRSQGGVMMEMKAVSSVLSYSQKLGWVTHNAARSLTRGVLHHNKRSALTPQEVHALIAAAPPYRARVYRVLAHTGMRRSEAKSMRWEWVQGQFIVVPADVSKSRRQDKIPLSPQAIEALGKPGKKGLVFERFPSRAVVQRDMARAGVTERYAGLHSLRRAFVTAHIMAGVSTEVTQMNARHANVNTTLRHYADLLPAEQIRGAAMASQVLDRP